jgi:glycosyltransferase involved in cell wall biosynthesis
MILSNPFMVDPRVYNEAKTLVDAGYEVSVIVWDREKKYRKEDTVDGIKLFRVHNKGLMRILPHDLLRNPLWWWKAYKKGVELYNDGFDFDVVHCHDLDTLATGVLLKKKLGVKLVYDAHEIFGYMIARDMPSFIVKISFLIEKVMVCKVDHVITVNEPLKDYFKSIVGKKPITIIMNCKDLILNEYVPSRNDVFTICYIGILHKNRMFPEIVDIIGTIHGVKFIIAGKKENLYEIVKNRSKSYSNVEFLGMIPFEEVIPTTLRSDVVVCMINPADSNNKIALANKQFEAMVCGRPIITTEGTYVGDITKNLNCGVVVNYDKESLKKAILELKDNKKLCEKYGKNGLEAAKNNYNWGEQKEKLLDLYQKVERLYE